MTNQTPGSPASSAPPPDNDAGGRAHRLADDYRRRTGRLREWLMIAVLLLGLIWIVVLVEGLNERARESMGGGLFGVGMGIPVLVVGGYAVIAASLSRTGTWGRGMEVLNRARSSVHAACAYFGGTAVAGLAIVIQTAARRSRPSRRLVSDYCERVTAGTSASGSGCMSDNETMQALGIILMLVSILFLILALYVTVRVWRVRRMSIAGVGAVFPGVDDGTAVKAPTTDQGPTWPDIVKQVERLRELHAEGVLTDEEFRAAKRRLLNIE